MLLIQVSEIDENTAIEYIEEDGVVAPTLTPTSITTAAILSKEGDSSESTILTKALTGVKNTSKSSSSSSKNFVDTGNTMAANKIDSEEISESTTAISNTQQQQQKPETKANNNSGTQVEP